jgi:hypothetical protein
MPTKLRQAEESQSDRLRRVYELWKEGERASGQTANVVGFATVLGFDSHSAVVDQLNGKRDLTSKMVQSCYKEWSISANWLLFGDGPMYAYEGVAQGDIEAQLAQILANRLNHEHAVELSKYGTRAISNEEQSPGLLVDARAALDHAYRAVLAEFRGALFALDVQSTKHEAIRQAQHAAVHGAKLRPLVEHEPFRRVVAHAEQAASSDRQTLRFVLRRG